MHSVLRLSRSPEVNPADCFGTCSWTSKTREMDSIHQIDESLKIRILLWGEREKWLPEPQLTKSTLRRNTEPILEKKSLSCKEKGTRPQGSKKFILIPYKKERTSVSFNQKPEENRKFHSLVGGACVTQALLTQLGCLKCVKATESEQVQWLLVGWIPGGHTRAKWEGVELSTPRRRRCGL